MLEDKNKSLTPIETLGEFKLIEHLTQKFNLKSKSTIKGVGDDAAVVNFGKKNTVITTDLLIEGVHFDLSYVPIKHLGYKAVMANLSDIYAMNGKATHITVSIAVSNRFSLEALEELYEGIKLATEFYNVDLIGGDTSATSKGLMISITALGEVNIDNQVYRSGAKPKDLLVVSGDLGGAYLGLQVLEREKEVFKVNPNNQPDLSPYTYIVGRQLKPEARKDVVELLEALKVKPTSMIDISDGLSSELIHICKASKVGCEVYENKIPLDPQVISTCEEFGIDSTTVALNGGEDYELLFTISQDDYSKIKGNPNLTVLGFIKEQEEGMHLITRAETVIELKAQGWKNFSEE